MQRIGNKIAAQIEPSDTILDIAIIANAKTKHISPIFQLTIKSTPSDVATPFPPLNLKNIGKVWPITTSTPAVNTNISSLSTEAFVIFATSRAISI